MLLLGNREGVGAYKKSIVRLNVAEVIVTVDQDTFLDEAIEMAEDLALIQV